MATAKRRWLFSRKMTFGPFASRTSATSESGMRWPFAGFDGQLGDLVRRIAPFERQADDEIHGALAFAQFGDFLAADQRGELFVEMAGRDAVGLRRGRGPPRCGAAEWRTAWSSLASSKPGMVLATVCTSMPSLAELVEIRTEDLHGDRRGNAAEHVADAVGQRSADHAEDAGHGFDLRADVIEDFLAAAASPSRGPPRLRWKSTSNSTLETGTTWSPRSARPRRRPTLRTSGTDRICCSSTSEIWFISSSEVPGAAVAATSAVSSWNVGRKSLPIFG